MKKALVLLLSVLVALNIFVSCNPDQNLGDQTRMVQFNDGRGIAKALDRAPEGLKTAELYWSYTAEKQDDSGFITGQTSGPVALEGTGLNATVGPFSQGEWKFTLYGYVDSGRTKLAWKGSKNEILSIVGGTSSPASVSVDVHRLRTAGVTGIIRVPAKVEILNNTSPVGTNYTQVVKIYKGEVLQDNVPQVVNGYNEYTIESGMYKVVVSAESNPGQEGNIVYAVNDIIVNVYDNLVTTVGGSLDEKTLETQFSTNEKGETVATSPSQKIEYVGAQGEEKFEIKVESTPAEDHSAAEKPTTVSFPKGAFTKGAQNASITVTPSTLKNANANNEFVVTADEAVVGAIDIDVMVDGNKTNTFEGNSIATVTTYIQPGLPVNAIAVKYNGIGDQPTLKSYDPTTGKLEFTTTHFSEYYVVVSNIVAIDVKTNTTYANIYDALKVTDGELQILKDVTINKLWTPVFVASIDFGNNYLVCDGGCLDIERKTVITADKGGVKGTAKQVQGLNVYALIYSYDGGDVNVIGGNYENLYAYAFSAMHSYNHKLNKLTISNANINTLHGAIVTNGTDKDDNIITMIDCNVTGGIGYLPGMNSTTLKGGVFNGNGNMLYQKVGALTLDGCIINSTEHNPDREGWYHYNNGCSDGPAPVIIEACGYPSNQPKVTIKDNVVINPASGDYKILVIDWREDNEHNYYRSYTEGIDVPFRYAEITSKTMSKTLQPSDYTVAITDANSIAVDTTWYNATDAQFNISTAAQLAGLSKLVSEGIPFKGKTITLLNDIDLAGIAWKPIGSIYRKDKDKQTAYDDFMHNSVSYPGGNVEIFKGNFDGKNHVIKNLTPQIPTEDNTITGLFGLVGGSGSIKNVTIESGTVHTNGDTASAVVGLILPSVGETFTVDNCKVGSSVTVKVEPGLVDGQKTRGTVASGVVGRAYGDGIVNVNNCSNAAAVHGQSKSAGIIGITSGESTVNVTGCTNTGAIRDDKDCAGGIIGWTHSPLLNINSCSNSGAVSSANYAGGIVGVAGWTADKLVVNDSSNTGNVTCDTAGEAHPILGHKGAKDGFVMEGNNLVN